MYHLIVGVLTVERAARIGPLLNILVKEIHVLNSRHIANEEATQS